MNKKNILFIFVLVFVKITNFYAQQIQFTHLGLKDGLSQSSIYSIYQDKKGFMWFGTADGLNKFDGNQIKTYKNEDDNWQRGTNFYGKGIIEDDLGNLFLSNRNGLMFYNSAKDSVYKLLLWKDTTLFNRMIEVMGITEGRTLWFNNCWDAVYTYDFVTHLKTKYLIESPLNQNRNAALQNNRYIWYPTAKGLIRYDTKLATKKVFLSQFFEQKQINKFEDLLVINNNKLLISFYLCAIELNPITGDYKIILNNSTKNLCNNIVQDGKGNIIIGTFQKGLFIVNKQGKVANYQTNVYKELSPGSNIITTLFVDRNDNIWMGCDGFGISKINVAQQKFKLYRTPVIDFKNQFSNNFIKCFYTSKSNKVWYGTHENGIMIWDRVSNKIQNIKSTLIGGNLISAILPHKNSKLIVCSGASVFEIDTLSFKQKIIPIKNQPVGSFDGLNLISSGIKTSKGSWYFTSRNGLYYFNEKKQMLEHLYFSWGKPYLNAITQTADGTIWISSFDYGYIYRLKELKAGQIELLDSCLYGYNVRCFYQDTLTQTLYMASEKGLIKYRLKQNNYTVINTKNGLSNNYVYAVLPGLKNQLWLSTNQGLICYNTISQNVKNYDEQDGLQSNEFNTGSYYKSNEGELFFGGINGFNSFYPQDIIINKLPPKLALTEFTVNEISWPYNQKENTGQIISLPNYLNTISFDFTALDFTQYTKNKYKIKLEGIDQNWVNQEKRHYARYSNLAPGKYSFWVKASNNDGVWSQPQKLLSLVILAPWWKRWYFIVLYALVLILITYYVIKFLSTRKLKAKLLELEKLEAVNNERLRISKDMHDDLGSGLTKIAITAQLIKAQMANTNELESQVEKMNKTATDLLDNMGHLVWAMNAENDTLQNFLAYTRQYVLDFLDGTSIKPNINFQEVNEQLVLNQKARRNIFLIVKECINNTTKYAKANNLTITFTIHNHSCKLIIMDDGAGFDTNNTRLFGNGLLNIKKRMDDIGGNFKILSQKNIGTNIQLDWTI